MKGSPLRCSREALHQDAHETYASQEVHRLIDELFDRWEAGDFVRIEVKE